MMIDSPVVREVVARNAKPWALIVALVGPPAASAAINRKWSAGFQGNPVCRTTGGVML
jgi:hypothetical protein